MSLLIIAYSRVGVIVRMLKIWALSWFFNKTAAYIAYRA